MDGFPGLESALEPRSLGAKQIPRGLVSWTLAGGWLHAAGTPKYLGNGYSRSCLKLPWGSELPPSSLFLGVIQPTNIHDLL